MKPKGETGQGRPRGTGKYGYKTRYKNPLTGLYSENSRYMKDGVSRTMHAQYFINNEWIPGHLAPKSRQMLSKYTSSKKGYFLHMKKAIKARSKRMKEKNRELFGENEFIESETCNQLMRHFDEQVEKYGNRCPITHLEFTMIRPHKKRDINNIEIYSSNISPDRIFSKIDYTKQNLIFTSGLWNRARGDRSLEELEIIFKEEIVERFKKILIEKFPDQKYAIQT